MARLLQVFGFLSVLFRGATLTFQSLAVGGIVFLMFVVLRADFVLAGVIGIVSAFTVIALSSSTRSVGYADLLLPAVAIIASSVMTSHSVARLEYRAPLMAFTALHQAATATWLGGLPYLLIAIRQAPSPEFARRLSARFSQLALVSVAVLASAGFLLSLA